ncbi:MAG: tRNA (N6-isopentenyl adenosine(37)-C2)-methylthiotransferase MiaB [Candidatus Krumholzibacteriota bacterium]|nr:tRNA (N6-isopentenyl adenosine(37)-C2)-methylthiotransferase MiaB [Candidatus Krumholzibacteriota bacterium]
MNNKKIYLKSFGCQMNAFDTEMIGALLTEGNSRIIKDPQEADIIIVNTCSIRKHAETRAINHLHKLSKINNAILAVCGCMAQRMGVELKKIVPGIDIISGPDNYKELVSILSGDLDKISNTMLLERNHAATYKLPERCNKEQSKTSKFLSITRGCENYCTYCVVPYLRGHLRSKAPDIVINEIQRMHGNGVKEITLLGQNVMAYQYGGVDFTSLMELILDETDIPRIRFLTTHPKDIRMKLFRLMSADSRVCNHIHLPLQSGSNRILKLMGRKYTREDYISSVEEARKIVPDLAITTDIIVGFPTEDESDFEKTMDLVEYTRFDSAFTFKYSPREGTAAYRMDDNVSIDTKKKRLERLNKRVKEIRYDIFRKLNGRKFKILLDGRTKKGKNHYIKGRTTHFRNVNVNPGSLKEGEFINVKLKKLEGFTFIGEEI